MIAERIRSESKAVDAPAGGTTVLAIASDIIAPASPLGWRYSTRAEPPTSSAANWATPDHSAAETMNRLSLSVYTLMPVAAPIESTVLALIPALKRRMAMRVPTTRPTTVGMTARFAVATITLGEAKARGWCRVVSCTRDVRRDEAPRDPEDDCACKSEKATPCKRDS